MDGDGTASLDAAIPDGRAESAADAGIALRDAGADGNADSDGFDAAGEASPPGDAGSALVAEGGSDADAANDGGAGPLQGATVFMPLGGRTDTCLTANGALLDVEACTASGTQQIAIVPSYWFRDGASVDYMPFGYDQYVWLTVNGQCIDILGGDLASGNIDLGGCNGTINQLWLVQGGQVVSANTTGSTFCLDVGSGEAGSIVSVAPCSGAASQSFWPVGYPLSLASTLVDPAYGEIECLDLLGDNDVPNAAFDDGNCNQTAAQVFLLNTAHHIVYAENPSMCIGLRGDIGGRVDAGIGKPLGLEPCSADPNQRWYLQNASVNGGCDDAGACAETMQSAFVNEAGGCLDIVDGNPTAITPVDDAPCVSGSAAQLWAPLWF